MPKPPIIHSVHNRYFDYEFKPYKNDIQAEVIDMVSKVSGVTMNQLGHMAKRVNVELSIGVKFIEKG